VAFKPNVRDARNSPAAEVMAELAALGAQLAYHDPHVSTFRDGAGASYTSRALEDVVDSDVVVALVQHRAIDWSTVYARAGLVVDAVNSSAGQPVRSRQVLRLGSGWL